MCFLPLLLLILELLFVSTEHTFYVRPANSSLDCPHDPCLTWDQYAHDPKSCTTRSTFLFLPGNHSVHFTISLVNVSDLVFREMENSSAVTVFSCIDVAIQCRNVTNLKIQGINFMLYSPGTTDKVVLHLLDSKEVMLIDLAFQGSLELADISVNSRAIFCQNSSIVIVYCLFQGNSGDFGGAIYASSGSSIILSGNIFIENTATQSGGAIFVHGSSLILNDTSGNTFGSNSAVISGGAIYSLSSKFEITSISMFSRMTTKGSVLATPCHVFNKTGEDFLQQLVSCFSNNYAMQGGAVYFGDHSLGLLTGCVVGFHANSANVGGAIVSTAHSVVTFSSRHLYFTANKALVAGGAYMGNYGSLSFGLHENTSHYFIANYGGAVYYQNGNVTISGNCLFKNNDAGYRNGGAISVNNCSLTISGETLFAFNHAQLGGAIYMLSSVAVFDGMVLEFANNSAYLGGAITTDGSTVVSTAWILNFTSNAAQRAGGAYYGNYGSLKIGGEAENSAHYFAENSAGRNSGGAMHYHYGTLTVSGNTTFTGNYVTFVGIDGNGGALFVVSCNFTLSGTALFIGNQAQQGGAVYLMNTTASFTGTALTFANNSADSVGGGLAVGLSRLVTTAKLLNFIGNSALQGGFLMSINSTIKLSSANFTSNTVVEVGGAILSQGDDITCHNINMTGNSRSAISLFNSKLRFSGNTNFIKNTGHIGGGITAKLSNIIFQGLTRFVGNSAFASGGALSGEYRTTYLFNGITDFVNNRAGYFGGAIHGFIKVELVLNGVCLFQNNSVVEADRMVEDSRDTVGGNGGAIFASDTYIMLNGTSNFTLNQALSGGAMYFENGATMDMELNTTLSTSHNHANKYGGVIYHADSITPSQCQFLLSEKAQDAILTLPNCFLDLRGLRMNNKTAPFAIQSFNDSAGIDGDFLFGGLIDKCRIFSLEPSTLYINATEIVEGVLLAVLLKQNIFNIDSAAAVSSEAYTLCFCESSKKLNCSKVMEIETYRGQRFTVSLLALSQGDTITSALLTSKISQMARLQLNQSAQVISRDCTAVHYNLYSTKRMEELIIYSNSSCRDTGHAQAVVNVTFRPCPDAFIQHADECICDERLQVLGAECVLSDEEIYIAQKSGSKFWLNGSYSKNGTYQGLILYQMCPVEFCTTEAVKVTLDQPDVQCRFNRSGLLCGACASGHSLLLGGLACGACSDSKLTLILLFAAAGIVLVILLSVLRFTVSTGLINSIILYTNIVQANRTLFFPKTTNALTVFIAWMNLDLGFQTCFYDGMDAYAQTFLQFAFPVYVWFLIGLIIVTSRYSIILTKLIGHNPIAVLATLLLMSYTKILKIIIEVYSFRNLQYPGGKTVAIWLKDANVPYLQSKHLLLTVVTSLVLVFFFLPYTIFLLLGYKMYRFSGRKYFRWINRAKPFLDSYYAPYNKHTRYWTGFMLLVRCVLYIAFSFNSPVSPLMDKSVIAAFTAIIVIAWLSVKIYKSFCVNCIEASVYLNLIILATFTQNSPRLVYPLVGIIFATTIGITLYHFHIQYIAKSSRWLKTLAKLTSAVKAIKNRTKEPLLLPPPASSHDPHKIISKTVIHLREPLLDN